MKSDIKRISQEAFAEQVARHSRARQLEQELAKLSENEKKELGEGLAKLFSIINKDNEL